MANRNGREVLRGVEVQTLDLIADVLTSQEWAELLKGPLERAAGQGDRSLARQLVKAGAEIGDALHAAVRGVHGEVVIDLLGDGAPTDAKHTACGGTPLHFAARGGNPEMVQLLMLKGADINAMTNDGWTPLYVAACCGHEAAAVALLAGGADVSIPCGRDKRLVVHVAADNGYVDILQAVIEHGADVEATASGQATALHLAAESNKAESIDVLVEAGADIEARYGLGMTPLIGAAFDLCLEALTTLLKHGACVNAKAQFGEELYTPLHYVASEAMTHEIAEVVDVLLRSGADETIVDHRGKTAADIVAEKIKGWNQNNFPEDIKRVLQLLENAPADRAWRRRGYLVLCRAHPNRMQKAQESSSDQTGTVPGFSGGAKLTRIETSCCYEGMGGAVDKQVEADWASVVARVVGLQEGGIFRTIVGYL